MRERQWIRAFGEAEKRPESRRNRPPLGGKLGVAKQWRKNTINKIELTHPFQ